MKMFSAALVAIVGVVCIVFGVLFIMQAGDAKEMVAGELAPMEISAVNAAYGQVSGALKANPESVPLTLQKLQLGLAKSNIATIKFLQNTGILVIVIGAGFVFSAAGLYKRD